MEEQSRYLGRMSVSAPLNPKDFFPSYAAAHGDISVRKGTGMVL